MNFDLADCCWVMKSEGRTYMGHAIAGLQHQEEGNSQNLYFHHETICGVL